MKAFFSSWKTSLFGLGAAAMNSLANGTSAKQVGFSVAIALLGLFANDHKQEPQQ